MTDHTDAFRERLESSAAVKRALALDGYALAALSDVADVVISALRAGNTIFWCGNGGSATDAEHLSAELLGRFERERRSLPSYSLASNVAAVTAVANDYGYDHVFARQLAGLGRRGDVVVGMSTSGNSPNVLHAFATAAELGVVRVGFTGAAGGRFAGAVDHLFRAPSEVTARIQECHMTVGHTICELAERALADDGG
jgi:D-sedoheptulose 7-phosphate isomerase